VTVQNKDLVEPDLSNARDYTHAYNAAIPLMALPIFFQETQFLSEAAREEIRPILRAYHEHRLKMNEGYLLLFRELHNAGAEKTLPLTFLRNRELEFHSVYRGPGTGFGGASLSGGKHAASAHAEGLRLIRGRGGGNLTFRSRNPAPSSGCATAGSDTFSGLRRTHEAHHTSLA